MAECQRYDREFVILCFSCCSMLLAEAAREASETATSSESDKIMPHLYVVEHRPHGLDHVEGGATNF